MKPDLRTDLEIALLIANVPHPYEVAQVVMEVLQKRHAESPETRDALKEMETRYDHEPMLTFAEREHHKAVERDAILRRKHRGR